MPRRTKLIDSPYNAYQNASEILGEDAELTHVGPGTPGGEYLRRFWHPIAFTNSLEDVPLRVRIMGEDLVLFRDKSSRIGLLALHCSHRGTSLEYGIIQERGLSCCYHGWHFDVDGRILDTPAEPPESKLKVAQQAHRQAQRETTEPRRHPRPVRSAPKSSSENHHASLIVDDSAWRLKKHVTSPLWGLDSIWRPVHGLNERFDVFVDPTQLTLV